MISTPSDLLKFANAMLHSYQQETQAADKTVERRGYLQPETVQNLWKINEKTRKKNGGCGLGWFVVPERKSRFGSISEKPFYVYHTGGAIGACSVLLILPRAEVKGREKVNSTPAPRSAPQGVSVAIICNLQGINFEPVAFKIAQEFLKC